MRQRTLIPPFMRLVLVCTCILGLFHVSLPYTEARYGGGDLSEKVQGGADAFAAAPIPDAEFGPLFDLSLYDAANVQHITKRSFHNTQRNSLQDPKHKFTFASSSSSSPLKHRSMHTMNEIIDGETNEEANTPADPNDGIDGEVIDGNDAPTDPDILAYLEHHFYDLAVKKGHDHDTGMCMCMCIYN